MSRPAEAAQAGHEATAGVRGHCGHRGFASREPRSPDTAVGPEADTNDA